MAGLSVPSNLQSLESCSVACSTASSRCCSEFPPSEHTLTPKRTSQAQITTPLCILVHSYGTRGSSANTKHQHSQRNRLTQASVQLPAVTTHTILDLLRWI